MKTWYILIKVSFPFEGELIQLLSKGQMEDIFIHENVIQSMLATVLN